MKKLVAATAFVTVCCLGNQACKKPPPITKEQVMQERLNERLQRWREGVDRNCQERVMDAASAIVDSTMLANARFERDTTGIPYIPGRPGRPDFKPPEDTTPVKPIFDVKKSKDTLGKNN